MDVRQQIIDFIKQHGPSVPTAIAKHLKADSLFISAFLSEMKENERVKISHIKIGGGSPLYYLAGQENMLQNFANYLGEKERKAFELLKEKKVLRDVDQVPVFRTALRAIKDFAAPLNVSFSNQKELFWKWHLVADEEAAKIIKSVLGLEETKKETPKEEIKEKVEPKQVDLPVAKPESLVEKKVEQKKEVTERQEVLKKQPEKKEVKEEKKEELVKKERKGEFYDQVKSYFEEMNIKVIEEIIIRKASEIDFIVELPSAVGSLVYYVKAKSKKKINDGDISSVFVQSQTKRLPALFLSKGDLTKKAQDMLASEFRGLKFNQI